MAVIDVEIIVYIILDLILALLILVGNVLVCCVVIYSSLRKKAMYMFVTSLALADILVGMTAIPFGILTKLGIPYDSPKLCIIMLSFIMISTQISIFNMTAISIERYLAIRYPRFHFTKLTTVVCFRAILVTWLLSVVVGFLPLLGWNKIHSNSSSESPVNSNSSYFNGSTNIGSMFSTVVYDNVTAIEAMTAASNNNTRNTVVPLTSDSLSNPGPSRECKFVEIMDHNYMFFNFIVCVIPALLICAGLYFVIFLSLPRSGTFTNLSKFKYKSSQSNISSKSSFDVLDEKQNNNGDIEIQLDYEDDVTLKETTELQTEDIALKEISLPQNGDDKNCICLGNNSDETLEKSLRNNLSREENTKRKLILHGYQHYLEDPNLRKHSENSHPTGRTISESNPTETSRQHIRQHRARKEIRAASVLGLIVLAFVICWLPIHVLNTILRFDRSKFNGLSPWVVDMAILLSHANSAVNFFLYSWRLKAFRDQLRRMLARKSSCIRWWKHR